MQIEAKKLAYADMFRYIGDPKTSKIPVSGMLSKQYAAERAKLIDMDHANCDVAPGTPVPDAGTRPISAWWTAKVTWCR